MPSSMFLVSPRGHALLLDAWPGEGDAVVTVENYGKWYGLFVVRHRPAPLGFEITEVPFPMSVGESGTVPAGGAPLFRDHVPNPKVVEVWAASHGLDVDPLAHQMMVGRWILESCDAAVPESTAYGYILTQGDAASYVVRFTGPGMPRDAAGIRFAVTEGVPEHYAQGVARLLACAYVAGQAAKAEEIRAALEVERPR